jgi:hypothetical protein
MLSRLKNWFKSITWIQWLAVGLIVGGLTLAIPRGMGLMDSFRESRFAIDHNFEAGNPSPDLLRPWMTIRYVSAAYGVPQKYLFDAAKIQPRKESSLLSLSRLNRELRLGGSDSQPALIGVIREAIVQYRLKPVATGLIERRVEDWMTMQYIANSTGIPEETLFNEAGLPLEGNGYSPMGYLADKISYPGGAKALIAAVQQVVDAHGTTVQP